MCVCACVPVFYRIKIVSINARHDTLKQIRFTNYRLSEEQRLNRNMQTFIFMKNTLLNVRFCFIFFFTYSSPLPASEGVEEI